MYSIWNCPLRASIIRDVFGKNPPEDLAFQMMFFFSNNRIKVCKERFQEVLDPRYPLSQVCSAFRDGDKELFDELIQEFQRHCVLPRIDLAASASTVAKCFDSRTLRNTGPFWINRWNMVLPSLPLESLTKIAEELGRHPDVTEIGPYSVLPKYLQGAEIEWVWARELGWLSIKHGVLLAIKVVLLAIHNAGFEDSKVKSDIERVLDFVLAPGEGRMRDKIGDLNFKILEALPAEYSSLNYTLSRLQRVVEFYSEYILAHLDRKVELHHLILEAISGTMVTQNSKMLFLDSLVQELVDTESTLYHEQKVKVLQLWEFEFLT